MEIRIAKFLSSSGLCSRRDAEKLIFEGKIKINGNIVNSPAIKVADSDIICFLDGSIWKEIEKRKKTRVWLYHKPVGEITSHKDHRKTVFDSVADLGYVISVGRLDINSEGLLILTNDGEYARFLEMPSNDIKRNYKVRFYGGCDIRKLESLSRGIAIDGINYKPIKVFNFLSKGSNSWCEVEISEGKNREIRKIFEHLGLKVNRLIRTSFGKYNLGKIKPGTYFEVDPMF